MKKMFRFAVLTVTLVAAASAHALTFETLADSRFVSYFSLTLSEDNRLGLTLFGSAAKYEELSFEILSGGPKVVASVTSSGALRLAGFNDEADDNFLLTSGTPYQLKVEGLTKGGAGSVTVSARYGSLSPVQQQPLPAITTTVPEPESFAMMLAGLGLMGVIARRRGKSRVA